MAVQRAETIATTIAESPLTLPSGESSPVSVSLGVAAFPADGRSYEDLLAVADARMYRRKATAERRRHQRYRWIGFRSRSSRPRS
jgi:diguanylate cyclase (GGDEF)-like protein